MKPIVKRHEVVQPQDQSIKLIPLTHCQNAIVDADDYAVLNQWNWWAKWSPQTKSYYAVRRSFIEGKLSSVRMHRQIMGFPQEQIDHENNNTLDNRKENLRRCNNSQNHCNHKVQTNNTSGTTGVSWDKRTSKWYAFIKVNRKMRGLGLFSRKEDAISARLDAERQFHGEFAYQVKHLHPAHI